MGSVLVGAGMAVQSRAGLEPGRGGRLSVVLCTDYLAPELATVAAAHRAAGRPWLLAKPVGTQVWVGPFFRPGESACWHCLADRLWQHRGPEACAQAALGRCGPAARPVVTTPALTGVAASLVALEAAKWLAGHRHPGQDAVQVLDGLDLDSRRRASLLPAQPERRGRRRVRAAAAPEPARRERGQGRGRQVTEGTGQ